MVEPFAIDSYHLGHRNEGFVVDALDEAEDLLAFATAGHDDEHTALLLGIPALAVQLGNTALHHLAYLLGYLLVLLRDNGELHALSGRCHGVVEQNHRDDEDYVTSHHLVPVVEHEEAARHDDEVQPHQHAAHGEVLVLIHYGGDDVGAAGGAVVDEHQRQRRAFYAGAYHGSHERLVAHYSGQSPVRLRYHALHQTEEEGYTERGVDGLGKELKAENLQTYRQKNGVDYEVTVLSGEAGGIVDDSRYTRHAARGELIREHEGAEAYAIAKASQCDEEIILYFVDNPA